MQHSKLVIIPTFNEKENIEKIVRKVFSLAGGYHILVIDDGSPDGTAAIVKTLQEAFLEHGYDYVFEMDADFSHNPDDLERLYEACAQGGADLAIGSRYCDGVSVVNWPIGRILMSYFASVYVRKVLGMKVFDCTAGFKCYSSKVLRAIDLDAIEMKGYGFQIEMKYSAYSLGFKLKEVPIIFTNRQKGVSKMSGGIFGEAFWGVLALRLRKITPRA